jgi:hypothetical protein
VFPKYIYKVTISCIWLDLSFLFKGKKMQTD